MVDAQAYPPYPKYRHAKLDLASTDHAITNSAWIPACAGMTMVIVEYGRYADYFLHRKCPQKKPARVAGLVGTN